MARIVPTDLSRRALSGGRRRELDTLALLRDRLPAELCVYHGVHWTREYRSGSAFGEIDFVVVDARGRALLIEQKSGALEERADGPVRCTRTGRSRSRRRSTARSIACATSSASSTAAGWCSTICCTAPITACARSTRPGSMRGASSMRRAICARASRRCSARIRAVSASGPMARRQRALPFAIDAVNELPGLGVDVHTYDAPEDQVDLVRRLVLALMRRGFAHEQIAIVSLRGAQSSVFSTLDRIGEVPLRRFTGSYDGPRQVMTDGRLRFESIYRFKGQEAPAVILVDVDPAAEPARLARDQKLLFCGVTRATVRLDVLARADNAYTRRLLAAL